MNKTSPRRRSGATRVSGRPRTPEPSLDPLDRDFGPGQSDGGTHYRGAADRVDDSTGARGDAEGLGEAPDRRTDSGRLSCLGEGCVFKPAADLVLKFTARIARGHLGSLSHAALSGIELMRALRDFLDEEIALAEQAAGRRPGGGPRYTKIPVE